MPACARIRLEKPCVAAIISVVIAGFGAAPVRAVPPGDVQPEIQRIVAEISPARIEARVRKLVSFGTRNTLSDTGSDTRGIGAARRWIHAELSRCSRESGGRLEVAYDSYNVGAGPRIPRPTEIVNVIATLPGTQPESRQRLVLVSGHYDSMPSSPVDADSDAPGANDDASGTAAVIELACVLARHRFDATLVFMAVAGEEQGLLGAQGYAQAAREKNLDIAAMFTNDIIGNTRTADGTVVRSYVRLFAEGVPPRGALTPEQVALLRSGGENDFATRQIARHVKAVAAQYVPGLEVRIVYRRDRYLRGGDHAPFLERGYPGLRFTEAVEDWRHQHQTPRVEGGVTYGDLPEFVDFAYIAEVARVNAAALATLARAPAPPLEVEIEALRLEADTTLRWKANPEPDVAGYRIVWRETTAALWQHARDVGLVTRTTIAGVSKDDFLFGVQAYDAEGHVSPATYPRPAMRP